MTIEAQTIIRDAGVILVDETGIRHPAGQLVNWLNAAQLMLAEKRPDAFTAKITHELVAGVRQPLPAAALKLVDILSNTSGAPMRHVDRASLDQIRPAWRTDAASTTARNWMNDEREPLVFEVYPPAALGASVELVACVNPTPVADPSGDDYETVSGNVAVNPLFMNALRDAVLYLALTKDTEHPANAARAGAHLASFRMAIGEEVQATAVVTPTPGKPGEPRG